MNSGFANTNKQPDDEAALMQENIYGEDSGDKKRPKLDEGEGGGADDEASAMAEDGQPATNEVRCR